MNSSDWYNQYTQALNTLQGYKPISTNDITSQLSNAVGNFAQPLQDQAKSEANTYAAVPTSMNQQNQQFGSSPTSVGPDVLTRWGNALQNMQNNQATTNTIGQGITDNENKLGGMAQNIADMYNQGRSTAQTMASTLGGNYNTALSNEAAIKAAQINAGAIQNQINAEKTNYQNTGNLNQNYLSQLAKIGYTMDKNGNIVALNNPLNITQNPQNISQNQLLDQLKNMGIPNVNNMQNFVNNNPNSFQRIQ